MGSLCSDSITENQSKLATLDQVNVIVILFFLAGCALVTVTATCYIFTRKNSDQRPLFVTLQMIFLNIFWMCFVVYFTSLFNNVFNTGGEIIEQEKIENMFATIGDTFFVIHDWLFTEQFLQSSLILPVAMDLLNQDDYLMKEQTKMASRVLCTARTAYYCMVVVWAVSSILTGLFVVRFAINILFSFITVIFTLSLLRIRRLISKIDAKRMLQVNYRLMNINLFCVGLQTVVYAADFVLAFYQPSSSSEPEVLNNQKNCRLVIAFDFFYWMAWVCLLTRTCLTSYMNIKFSQSLEQTNRQFFMIFNADLRTVQKKLQEGEEIRRAERLDKFYQDYANQQLTRIIMSFMNDESESAIASNSNVHSGHSTSLCIQDEMFEVDCGGDNTDNDNSSLGDSEQKQMFKLMESERERLISEHESHKLIEVDEDDFAL